MRTFSLPTAPTAAPVGLDVTSQSANSISLTWAPPQLEEQNGVITRYTVNVTNVNTGESVLLYTTETSITVQQLTPFTAYLCSVAAETSVGLGPYTLALTVTTNEDGKCYKCVGNSAITAKLILVHDITVKVGILTFET